MNQSQTIAATLATLKLAGQILSAGCDDFDAAWVAAFGEVFGRDPSSVEIAVHESFRDPDATHEEIIDLGGVGFPK